MNTELINICEAREENWEFIKKLMREALEPFYDGGHEMHGKRIFSTHISGGKDNLNCALNQRQNSAIEDYWRNILLKRKVKLRLNICSITNHCTGFLLRCAA